MRASEANTESSRRHKPKFRYTASHLFYFLSLCAASVALFGWLGLPIGCFVMLIWVQIFVGIQREDSRKADPPDFERRILPESLPGRTGASKVEMLAVLLIVFLLVGLFAPANSDSDPMQHAQTSMKMVAKAVAAYHQHHGQYPPQVLCDDSGNPLHSWRALILPYLHEDKLAAFYRWDEPWDGPQNQTLAQYRPWHYRIYYPTDEFPRDATSLQLLTDDTHGFFIVEHEQKLGNWLEPTVLSNWEAFSKLPSDDRGFWNHGFFASHYRGRLAVSQNLTLCIHPNNPLAIPSADEIPGNNASDSYVTLGHAYHQIHYDNALRLGFFLLLALYPFRWLKQRRI